MIVVDASVAVKWYVREEGWEEAALLLDARFDGLELLVPDIFLVETMNALLRKVRVGQMVEAQLAAAREHLDMLAPRTIAAGPILDRAIALAASLDHALYDCLYLACAELHGCPLATADDRFARKLQRDARVLTLGTIRPFVSRLRTPPSAKPE